MCADEGRNGGFEAAASRVSGKKVEVLGLWLQIRRSWSLGAAPGRFVFIVFAFNFLELETVAAHQRLWARCSAALREVVRGGGFLRRLRRCGIPAFVDRVGVVGESKFCCSSFSLVFFFFVCTCPNSVLVSI